MDGSLLSQSSDCERKAANLRRRLAPEAEDHIGEQVADLILGCIAAYWPREGSRQLAISLKAGLLRQGQASAPPLLWLFDDFQYARRLALQCRVQLPCDFKPFAMSCQHPFSIVD